MKIFSRLGKSTLAAGAIMGLSGMMASAIVAPAPAYAYVQPIWLNVNQSYYLSTQAPIARVAVASPDVADVVVLADNAVNIVAKSTPGTTTVNVWTKNGMRQEFKIVVSEVNDGLADQIKQAINLPHVAVRVVKDRVLLSGYVNNQYEKELAYKIAALYVGDTEVANTDDTTRSLQGAATDTSVATISSHDQVINSSKVVNLLQMINPEQINIEAMVIEIDADDTDKLGITYGSPSLSSNDGTSGTNSVTYGTSTAGSFYAGESYGAQRAKGSHWYSRNWLFTHFSQINAQINALVERGKARIVSRPNVTTMSGKSAGIFVGGKVPYQTVNSDGNVSTEFKDYGIQLNLVNPAVDRDGNITSELLASVSRLDWSNGITVNGNLMPAINESSAVTTVNIPSGMTMAIGGLLRSDDAKTVTKVPLLGDIPVLGELFKYSNTQNKKSEIVVLITPRVVNETTPVRMSERMTDLFNDSRRESAAMNEIDPNGPIPEKKEVKSANEVQEAKNTPSIKERTAAILAESAPNETAATPAVKAASSAKAASPALAAKPATTNDKKSDSWTTVQPTSLW